MFLRHLRSPRSVSLLSAGIRPSLCKSIHNNNLQKPFYITTPIFYPNASPHIGHLYSLVTADVLARYQRMKGRDVQFLAGTDEHGLKIQKAARLHFGGELGREREFCDTLSERFRDLGRRANISNTCFMRTSSKEHHRAVEHVWRDLYSKGYIYKSQYSGWYSITDECFYTDSQVQDGHSIETGAAVEWTSEENYMFRLSAFREALLEHYTTRPGTVYPPQYHENVMTMLGAPTEKLVSSPAEFSLDDISISRPRSRLEWGVQVPDDPEQTVYVWFDALLIYLTGAGYPWPSTHNTSGVASTPSTVSAWPADVQVIGKDILRFHAIYFPAILLALSGGPYVSPLHSSSSSLNEPQAQTYTTQPSDSGRPSSTSPLPLALPLSKTLLTHAHWTSSQKKMSKSLGNVADPLEAMDKWGVDVVRFYMMRVGGRWRDDVDWSSEQLDKHHKEVQSQLGNYFLRITSPRIAERALTSTSHSGSGSATPDNFRSLFRHTSDSPLDLEACLQLPMASEDRANLNLLFHTLALQSKVDQCMEMMEAGQALAEVMAVLKVANKTLTDIAPWAPTATPETISSTRIIALETLRVVGVCLQPFMPVVAGRLLDALGVGLVEEECAAVPTQHRGSGMEADPGLKVDVNKEVETIWQRWQGRKVVGSKLF